MKLTERLLEDMECAANVLDYLANVLDYLGGDNNEALAAELRQRLVEVTAELARLRVEKEAGPAQEPVAWADLNDPNVCLTDHWKVKLLSEGGNEGYVGQFSIPLYRDAAPRAKKQPESSGQQNESTRPDGKAPGAEPAASLYPAALPRTVEQILATGAGWITESELAMMGKEIRDLRKQVAAMASGKP